MQSLLFSTEMVKSLMANRKTETRRMRGLDVINENPDNWALYPDQNSDGTWSFHQIDSGDDLVVIRVKQPFKIGPCWVRETFAKIHYEGVDSKPTFIYKADNDELERIWTPSIHMPFIAARNFIHIDEVTLERLHDITDDGAMREGIEYDEELNMFHVNYDYMWFTSVRSFQALITSINGLECWEKNMWVWVIKFHRISKPN